MFRKLLKLNTIRILLAAIFIGALLPLCLPVAPVFAATMETLKPTAYTYYGSGTNTNPQYAYDFTTGGDSTTYNQLELNRDTDDPCIVYRSWQTTSDPHSQRRLYVRRSGGGFSNDYFRIQYSTDGGYNYTVIETNLLNETLGNSPVVYIPTSVSLSNLRVRIDMFVQGRADRNGYARIYDVWLECDYALPRVGTQISGSYPITLNPSPMTPQQEWTTVTVPVWHGENISSIDSVEIKLFFDSVPSNPAESGFSFDAQTCAVFTWTRGTSPEWNVEVGTTTWAINDTGCSKPSDTVQQGNFVFSIKVGKVATCSTANASNWDIYAIATDYKAATSDDYLRDVEVNWYGEVSVSTVDVEWMDIIPGSDFSSDTKQTDISVTYIANGVYYQKAAAATPWTSGAGNAALNTGGTPGEWQFSLKVDDTDNLTAAVLTNAYPTFVTIGSGAQTTESGNEISTNTIWLKLGAVIPNATFSGTLYYMIGNTS